MANWLLVQLALLNVLLAYLLILAQVVPEIVSAPHLVIAQMELMKIMLVLYARLAPLNALLA